jgi:hypothetical protein
MTEQLAITEAEFEDLIELILSFHVWRNSQLTMHSTRKSQKSKGITTSFDVN